MKRIITLLLLLAVGAGVAPAQIVRSQSRSITVVKEEKPKVVYDHNWFVKAGGGIMVDDGDGKNEGGTHGKYDIKAGYQQQFSRVGFYWGAQAGLNSFCYDGRDSSGFWGTQSGPAIFLGPTIGIKRSLGINTTFDAHIGAGYAHLFASHDDGDDANRVVWELGLGIWYKRFLFEVEYQGSYGYVMDNGVLFNIGFKF